MKRVGILMTSKIWGGAERVTFDLAEAWANNGIQVDVILLRNNSAIRDFLPVNVNSVLCNSTFRVSLILHLILYIFRCKPDVILVPNVIAVTFGAIARRLAFKRTKLIVVVHCQVKSIADGSVPPATLPLWAFKILTYMHLCADHAIAVSEGVKKGFCDYFHVPPNGITRIYNPLKLDHLRFQAGMTVDHPWLIQHDLPVILTVCRLHPQKDIPTLLHAFRQLQAICPSRLIILGEGPLGDSLKEMAVTLGIADKVGFYGFCNNPYAFMSKADLFVLSTHFEGFAMVLLEALACGCPVVSSDVPSGPDEILMGGKYGKLVPPRDPEALCRAMQEVLDGDHPAPAVLKQRVEEFAVENIARQYEALLFPEEKTA